MIRKLVKIVKGNSGVKNQNASDLPLIYSHPRSGTHLLAYYIQKAFFEGRDLDVIGKGRKWGHWAERVPMPEVVANAKLFAVSTHKFPNLIQDDRPQRSVYIVRDVREVAFSCFRSEGFQSPKHKTSDFSEFIRQKIDWVGSQGAKAEATETIIEHWIRHVNEWTEYLKGKGCLVSYETLHQNPHKVMNHLSENIDLLGTPCEFEVKKQGVGLSSNFDKKDTWKNHLTESDEELIAEVTASFADLKNEFI